MLVSGAGTNLQALLDAGLPVVAVASNEPGAHALERASAAGIASSTFALADYAGADLLAPTRLYLEEVRRLRPTAHAFAHVTGGGILGNLDRVLPDGLRAEIQWDAWNRPPVFAWLARHVAEDELRRVFNLGIGYLAVVQDPGDDLVIGRIIAA